MSLYYEDDYVTLYHGNCLERQEWLAADVLVTDPPYGIGWKKGEIRKAHNSAKNHGIQNDSTTDARDRAIALWGTTRPALVFGSLQAEYPTGWKRVLVFEKPRHAGLIGSRVPWFRNWEPIFMLGEWPDQTPTRSAVIATQQKSASGYSGYTTLAGHSHAKPNDVMESLIEACPPGIIADPFAGSGSTLLAAKNLGRKSIGVELEERYCEVIAKRCQQEILDLGSAV